ncbi:type IV pilin protein [Roseateles sp.]|uniref:type IV pilin protein n=1 Tax=Roseateles sp. TaxID=1971397 RepID=UPI0035A0AD01
MPKPGHPAMRGFSLIELMVVVVIAGILAAVAYPAYTSHVQRGRRADAMAVLTAVVQAQERYRANNATYAATASALGVDVSQLTQIYSLTLAGVGNPPSLTSGYVATAAVLESGVQRNDSTCATIGVQLQGGVLEYVATNSSNADTRAACWGR